ASLLGLAEERFQRPFGLRDVLDVHVLAASMSPAQTVVDTVRSYGREPEILELLTYADERLEIGQLRALKEALVQPARDEQARRNRSEEHTSELQSRFDL